MDPSSSALIKNKLKRFAEFLQMNSMAILSGATLEFEDREYSAETELVQYQWCISIIVMTFVRVTSFKIQDRDSSSAVMSNLLTIFGGWWGVPWGPIRSIQCLAGNCKSKIVTIRMLLCGNGFN